MSNLFETVNDNQMNRLKIVLHVAVQLQSLVHPAAQ
jgi:hypothetical protein